MRRALELAAVPVVVLALLVGMYGFLIPVDYQQYVIYAALPVVAIIGLAFAALRGR